MASGSFNVTTNNSNIAGKVVWNSTSNIEGNYSLVSATLYLSRTNSGYTTSGNGTWSMNINGDSTSVSKQVSLTYNSNTTIISRSNFRVDHNGDGSKQCTISVTGGIPDTSYSATYGSSNVSLDTIPRASDVVTFNNFTIGNDIPIVLNTKSTNFHNDIAIDLNGVTVVKRSNITDSYTLQLTEAEQDLIYKLTPNASSVQVALYAYTYNGATFIGQSKKIAMAIVGVDIIPTFTGVSTADTNTNVATTIGKFVQNLSKIKCTINGASGIRHSTIKDYQIDIFTDGVADYYAVYRGQSVTLSEFSFAGNINIKGTITDSRGRQASKTITITLLPYTLPRITKFTVTRATSSGTVDNLGTYAKLTCIGSVASLVNGTEKNTLTYVLYARQRGAESWGIPIKTTTTTINLNTTNNLGVYAITNAWEFRLDIMDKFKTTMSMVTMSTSQVTMSWGRAGVGVGKVLENGALDVAGDIYANGVKVYSPNNKPTSYDVGALPINGGTITGDLTVSNIINGSLIKLNGVDIVSSGDGWTRFADGTQIVWSKQIGTYNLDVVYGNVWFYNLTLNYSIAFTQPPTVNISCISTGVTWSAINFSNTSTVGVRLVSPQLTKQLACVIDIVAIGRWK